MIVLRGLARPQRHRLEGAGLPCKPSCTALSLCCLQDFIDKLAGSASVDEQAQLEIQFSLAAYSKCVLKRVCDDVPLCAKLILVTQVLPRPVDAAFVSWHQATYLAVGTYWRALSPCHS